MPLGPFGEVLGTTGTLDSLDPEARNYESRVVAPRNPKLIRDELPPIKMTPSQYMFQMSLTTEKKLANTHNMQLPKKLSLLDMGETTHQRFSQVDIEEPIFQPYPSELVFVNYEPNIAHELPLLLRNNDKVPRLVKVVQADSPYFKIISPHNVGEKCAPGLAMTFVIQFIPDEKKDYRHELVCITEREKFVVPVRCVGARAILDFPDSVNFDTCPVKYRSERSLLVRNVGNREARFFLRASKPFHVTPETGTLAVQESLQVCVGFEPQTSEPHQGDLEIEYDTGERIYAALSGVGQDVNVRLDKSSIRIESTYVGLANQRTVTIVNRSDTMANFRFTKYATALEEEMEREMMDRLSDIDRQAEIKRFAEELGADPTVKDKMAIINRSFLNRRRQIDDNQLVFEDEILQVNPVSGEVWPNSSREVTLTFRPAEATTYNHTLFCDVTGRQTRLALKVTGIGVGPKIQFSFNSLDLGFLFVNSVHTYELVLANKGHIDAIYKIQPSSSQFAKCFHFHPDDGIVSPGGHQAIHIRFSSSMLGDFDENFHFQLEGSPEALSVNFRGSVIGPTFHFESAELRFNSVSLGFPSTQTVLLNNTSLIPMDFRLRVPGDGQGQPVCALEEGNDDSAASPRAAYRAGPPQEFSIDPESGHLDAMSSVRVAVTLTANCCAKFKSSLVVDVENVGQEVLAIPIVAKSIVPDIMLEQNVLDYHRLFLNHPYPNVRTVGLVNSTELPAKYELLPQENPDAASIVYFSPQPKGIIQPKSTFQMPLTVAVRETEEREELAYVKIFGSDQPPLVVCIKCFGEGPVVHVTPYELDFGRVPVLTDIAREICLSNESLIPAEFACQLARKDSQFRVVPEVGVIEPNQSVRLTLLANLNDCLRFQDKLLVQVKNENPKQVALQAYGQGTTIVTEPGMPEAMDLGPQFSKTDFVRRFQVRNCGRRHQQLVWTTEGYSHVKAVRQAMAANSDHVTAPIFSVTPHRFDLTPGQSAEILLRGRVDEPARVEETLLCHAIIGRQGGKELIKRVNLCVDFVNPMVQFSSPQLYFRVEKLQHDTLDCQTQPLTLENVSGLQLHCRISVSYPFQLVRSDASLAGEANVTMEIGDSLELRVQFDPSYKTDLHSRVAEDFLTVEYREHPHVDRVPLRGEVHFPNLSFERDHVNFGCILNHTEVTRYLNVTNTSPLPVSYRWKFLIGEEKPNIFFHRYRSRSPEVMRVLDCESQAGEFDEAEESPAADAPPSLMVIDAAEKDVGTEKTGRDFTADEDEVVEEIVVPRRAFREGENDASMPPQDEQQQQQQQQLEIVSTSAAVKQNGRPSTAEKSSGSQRSKRSLNPKLRELLEQDREIVPLGIEEVFDILPIHGLLPPGMTEQLTLTFFGHPDIEAQVTAICEVDGGPDYELRLSGESSLIDFELSTLDIDYGCVLYNEIAAAELCLTNRSRVEFAFAAPDMPELEEGAIPPVGVPIMRPAFGAVPPNASVQLRVLYHPGHPDAFQRAFKVQVAHFPTQEVTVRGVASFPRLFLDIPRCPEAIEMEAEVRKEEPGLDDLHVKLEAERRFVDEFAKANPPLDGRTKILRPTLPEYVLDFGYVLLSGVEPKTFRATNIGETPLSFRVNRNDSRAFGFAFDVERVRDLPPSETQNLRISFDPRGANLELGAVQCRVFINLVNGPCLPLLLKAFVTMPCLTVSRDLVDFHSVRCSEAKVITVQLHNCSPVPAQWSALPDSALTERGKRKKAADRFSPLYLRQQQQQQLQSSQDAGATTPRGPEPPVFEMIPGFGDLRPGQKLNVQIKFIPREERSYESRLNLRIGQSSQRLLVMCRGQGLEPRLEFDSNMIEFGPILPFAQEGAEREIVVRNPCDFPIEFYSLEYDKFYLEEEKILRQIPGYDEYNTLLLPPRRPGEKLPPELLEYYAEQLRKYEAEKARQEADEAAAAAAAAAAAENGEENVDEVNAEAGAAGVGSPIRGPEREASNRTLASGGSGIAELEATPVSMAIARYLGIDLSSEGRASRNRRGIAIIVHGAPLSGKSDTAVLLAKHYEAALLSIDSVVKEAIASGASPAGKKARELCSEAARLRMAEDGDGGVDGDGERPGLSQEALAALAAQEGRTKVTAAMTAQALAAGKKVQGGGGGGRETKTGKGQPASHQDLGSSQVPSSPPPLAAPIARKLSISASDDGLLSTVLPEEILVELLSDRFQLNDCSKGIVIDSLDTLFCNTSTAALQCVLKALNNRKFIFFVTLKLDFAAYKDRQTRKEAEEEERKQREAEEERRRLEEMDEDEYEALTEAEREAVDAKRLEIKRERRRKEKEEKKRKIEEEQQRMEAQLRQMEEEKNRRKKKPAAGGDDKAKAAQQQAKAAAAAAAAGGKSKEVTKEASLLKGKEDTRPESHATEKSDQEKQQQQQQQRKKRSKSEELREEEAAAAAAAAEAAAEADDPVKQAERLLRQRFKTFEHEVKNVIDLLAYWDRSCLAIRRPATPSEGRPDGQAGAAGGEDAGATSGKKGGGGGGGGGGAGGGGRGKKGGKADAKEVERLAREAAEAEALAAAQAEALAAAEAAEGTPEPGFIRELRRPDDGLGVPHLIVYHCPEDPPGPRLLECGKLPQPGEILDGLGLGPSGPPQPPDALFSVVTYPQKRRPPNYLAGEALGGHYAFLGSQVEDPNAPPPTTAAAGVHPSGEAGEETSDTRSVVSDAKDMHSSSSKLGGSTKSSSRRSESRRDTRKSPGKKGGKAGKEEVEEEEEKKEEPRIGTYRWVIPPNGVVRIRTRFMSDDLGQFDQTLNFEIQGWRTRYQLFCRGLCAFPTISREPRILFPQRRKAKAKDEVISKKYILATEVFEFGPLLVGKTKDKIKDGVYPENRETFTIHNSSPMEADINFCLLSDVKGETFSFEPSAMTLAPGESQPLTVWAHPLKELRYEDAIVACVRENPEPILLRLACECVRPKLLLDKTALQFEKVLLQRKDVKQLFMRNETSLPINWRISGLEVLGEDFSVNQDSGTLEPKSEGCVNFFFRAMRPYKLSQKRSIRIETFDVDNILGVLETLTVNISAEAYDVAIDLSFPKGNDGSVDFGVKKVGEEEKVQLSLKNKGSYEIRYRFVLKCRCRTDETSGNCRRCKAPIKLEELFDIQPAAGILLPNDRTVPINITFRSSREVSVKLQELLFCEVIEPSLGDSGELIASIPVKVSAQAVYSKFVISPSSDLNFGAVMVQARKTRSFQIENRGQHEFRFVITRKTVEDPKVKEAMAAATAAKGGKGLPAPHKRAKSRDGSSSGRSVVKPKKVEAIRAEAGGQGKLQAGAFQIQPAADLVPPGTAKVVQVDFIAESEGRCDEELLIDIADRDPALDRDGNGGIRYRLVGEAFVPVINTTDWSSIFEEHRVCRSLSLYNAYSPAGHGGVYGEAENRFVFNSVLVGCRSSARFRVSNPTRINVDVTFGLRPVSQRAGGVAGGGGGGGGGGKSSSAATGGVGAGGTAPGVEMFELEPVKAQIPASGHTFVTVHFSPPSMHNFTAVFEAAISGPVSLAKGRSLTFELAGEGNLPRVSVSRPTARNKRGQPLCLFRKLLVGREQRLRMALCNDGSLPARLHLDLMDPDGCFRLEPAVPETRALMTYGASDGHQAAGTSRHPHTAALMLEPGQEAELDAIYRPRQVQRSSAQVKVAVVDNQYEDTIVHLVGEGYEDEVTFENLPTEYLELELAEEANAAAAAASVEETEETPNAAKHNHLHFGDCYLVEPKILTFQLCNHSQTDTVRFAFPTGSGDSGVTFLPAVGHLRPGQSKSIAATYRAAQPQEIRAQPIACRLVKLTYKEAPPADWDDTKRTMRWLPVDPAQPAGRKKKVVEVEAEPEHTELPDSQRSLELLVSAKADQCKLAPLTETVQFRDTLLFQRRVHQVQLVNTGRVAVAFSWQVVMETVYDQASGSSSRPQSARQSNRQEALLPFAVEPESGTVPVGRTVDVMLAFAPLALGSFKARLVCRVPNLEEGPAAAAPCITVTGRSVQPFCHFELPQSDYLTGAKRNPELPGPNGAPPGAKLNPDTRVVEIDSVGLDNRALRRFHIVNPTSVGYAYQWECQDGQNVKDDNGILCLDRGGYLEPGRGAEVAFEYMPKKLGVSESFWCFSVPAHGVSLPFLVVGRTKEPRVAFDRSHHNFNSLLLQFTAQETFYMTNEEDQAFQFDIDPNSLRCPGHPNTLRVEPMSGLVPKRGRLDLTMTLCLTSEKPANFNLRCNVRNKTEPLTLNVKAEGYCMKADLLVEDPESGQSLPVSEKTPGQLDFSSVEVNEVVRRRLVVWNRGKFDLNFAWSFAPGCKRPDSLTVTPVEANVPFGERKICELVFAPKSRCQLKGTQLVLTVPNGPTYQVAVLGGSTEPKIGFAFGSKDPAKSAATAKHDFGPKFVFQAGMDPATAQLFVHNLDSRPITVDCLYTTSQVLHHDFKACLLQPGQSTSCSFTFLPREAVRYEETVTFELNGLTQASVQLAGRGSELRIEPVNPRQRIVHLGVAKIGELVKKVIPVTNRGLAPVPLRFVVSPASKELAGGDALTIKQPKDRVTLNPQETVNVEIAFRPSCRVAQFTEEVLAEAWALSPVPVLAVRGACLAHEFRLSSALLSFLPPGPSFAEAGKEPPKLVVGSQSKRSLILYNCGDIGARFAWDTAKLKPDFSISPESGYLSPGAEVTIEVTFKPTQAKADIRIEGIKCRIEGWKDLDLTLTGTSAPATPVRETPHFICQVRQKDTKPIQIFNNSHTQWKLRPVIDGDYWSGPDILVVEPQQTKTYELTYRPLRMTLDGKKHSGTLFFALPDGTGLLYNLLGSAEEPRPLKVTQEIPCKMDHYEVLPVQNWLPRAQRFKVTREILKPDKIDAGTTFQGLDYIDVPGDAKRDYKLHVFCYREAQYQLRIRFENEDTGEYVTYEVFLKAGRPGSVGSISLSSPVRQAVQHSIEIENPLAHPVTLTVSTTLPEVRVPSQLQIPQQTQGQIEIEFLPLKPQDYRGKLELQCPELGLFTYELDLKGTQPGPERALHFTTHLGGQQVLQARFVNYGRSKADFACRIEPGADFHCDKAVTVSPGSEGVLDVVFEPCRLGDIKSALTVTSQSAGAYLFPLHAVCLPPKPQGPFVVKAGATTTIAFRNVFPSATQFTFQVDNPAFTVHKPGDTVRPHKEYRIVVAFNPGAEAGQDAVMAKLLVTCARSTGAGSVLQWVYYLRGHPPDRPSG